MAGSGRDALPDVRNRMGGCIVCSSVVGRPSRLSAIGMRPSQMYGSGREALPDVRNRLGGPIVCSRVVGRPSWMSVSRQVALPDVCEWLGGPP